ncbi:MAG: hypothetical protein ACRD9R_16365 [Pyrinomonadaceae bacterium]
MRYLLVLLLGAIIGAVLSLYFFVGAPRVKQTLGAAAGAPVQAPEAAGDPPGTAVLTLDEKFFDELLGTIFTELQPPTFQLGSLEHETGPTRGGVSYVEVQDAAGGCRNQVTVVREMSGTRTGVKLVNGQIVAPLAFGGSYNLFGCADIRGTAQATIALSFDRAQQTLSGQLNVEGVNVEGVPAILSGPVTAFVQNAINQRVNPLTVLRGSQLSLNVPVQASNGTLRAQATDVRSEVKDGALRLHIIYDFSGTPATTAPGPPPPAPPAN